MSHLSCIACSGSQLSRVYDFGLNAPSTGFLTPQRAAEPEPIEPLILYRCCQCGLLQIGPHACLSWANDSPATTTDPRSWLGRHRQTIQDRGGVEWDIPDVLALHDHLQCDVVRHETLAYWTIQQLDHFLIDQGLTLKGVRPTPHEPGMLRVTVTRGGLPSTEVKMRIAHETEAELESPRAWADFALLLDQSRNLLNSELDEWQYRSKKLVAYTVSGRGMTTLSLCDAYRRFPCLIDENPDRWGLLTPGHRIPIVGPERLRKERFDVLLLLGQEWDPEGQGPLHDYWHAGGRILIPAPKPGYADAPRHATSAGVRRESAIFADFG